MGLRTAAVCRRLLFYWGIGKEQNGRQDISWMPDAERDKVKEKEEKQRGKKP